MRKFAAMTGVYALSHLIVDFSCAYLIFSRVHGAEKWLLCLIIYNFFAFALQMPLGIIADKAGKNRAFAALGTLLIAVSPALSFSPLLLCSVAGLGNAFFHIGAGRDVLQGRGKEFSALGIFVSPGAMGLYLGTLCGKSGTLPLAAVTCVLAAVSALIWFYIPRLSKKHEAYVPMINGKASVSGSILFILICLFIVVCLRSYVGSTLSFPWKGEGHFALYLVIAVVCGKALGGVFADRFGAMITSFVSLLSSALLLLFFRTPLCGILAIFLFNMTMPITLGTVARKMPERLGFGFGLLTFGLFIGIIPAFLSVQSYLALPYGYTAVCVISAGLLYYGLKEPRKELEKNGA
ncbi:MAG: hypothetical protein QMB62_12370 [Oscillospiraceae bacterium]